MERLIPESAPQRIKDQGRLNGKRNCGIGTQVINILPVPYK